MGWYPPAGYTPATAAHTKNGRWLGALGWLGLGGQRAGTWWHWAANPSKPAPPPHLVQRGVGIEEAGGHRSCQAHVAEPQHLQPALPGGVHVQGRSGVCWKQVLVALTWPLKALLSHSFAPPPQPHRPRCSSAQLRSRLQRPPAPACTAHLHQHQHQHLHLHLQHAPAPACTAGRSRPGCRSAGCRTAQPPAGRAAPPGCAPPHQCRPAGLKGQDATLVLVASRTAPRLRAADATYRAALWTSLVFCARLRCSPMARCPS